jgi:hypothetical protein
MNMHLREVRGQLSGAVSGSQGNSPDASLNLTAPASSAVRAVG